MQSLTATPKVSTTGTQLVQITDGSGNLTNVSTDSVNENLNRVGGSLITLGQKVMASSVPVVIASNQTTLPVSFGLPPYLSSTFGYATTINQPSANPTDNPLIYIRNPTGSGKTLYLSFFSYGISANNVWGVVRVYRNPTVTANGTAQTIVAFGGGTTAMLLNTTPTVTSNGTMMINELAGVNSSSILVSVNLEISILANESLLLTGSPLSANRTAEISIRWIEI